MFSKPFPALPGFYQTLFYRLEPISTLAAALVIWFKPGAAWFYHQLIPSTDVAPTTLEPRAEMAIWQLGNCFFLLAMMSPVLFRTAREALANDLVAQERIVGAALFVLAVADVSRDMAVTLVALPPHLRFNFLEWNSATHGNITVVIVLLATRISWFLGIGRTSYYYGQFKTKVKAS
ncbi:hypothetical protein BDN72DRAFT_753471 [Pluteus cervinus]|uniref:Uncharacterized protein n=1 Tax=Pluteus cervinus TaxID=181527 RepID=A0ACD3BG60_9AGAR|nr:hypothetical protein BDN72DRAFT_753471 [Pluteus cervinus]